MERGFMSMGPWNTGAPQREDMPRKPIDIKTTDYPVIWKRGLCTLFPLPAGTGLGRAQIMGQGTGPLWGLGQRPKVLNHQYLQFSRFN